MKTSISGFTIVGLLLAFFGATAVLMVFNQFVPGQLTNTNVIIRELSVFAVAGLSDELGRMQQSPIASMRLAHIRASRLRFLHGRIPSGR